jgi:hypothetical protein
MSNLVAIKPNEIKEASTATLRTELARGLTLTAQTLTTMGANGISEGELIRRAVIAMWLL